MSKSIYIYTIRVIIIVYPPSTYPECTQLISFVFLVSIHWLHQGVCLLTYLLGDKTIETCDKFASVLDQLW